MAAQHGFQPDSPPSFLSFPRLGTLGAGSDYAPFVHFLGISSMDIAYTYDPVSRRPPPPLATAAPAQPLPQPCPSTSQSLWGFSHCEREWPASRPISPSAYSGWGDSCPSAVGDADYKKYRLADDFKCKFTL